MIATSIVKTHIGIPKLTTKEVDRINKEKPGSIVKLKDSDGKEHNTIIVEDQSGEKIAYKVNEGSLGKLGRSRKGNEIIREEISSSDLSDSLKNKLEELFGNLNVGYTKSSDAVTGSSQIVVGARRKTQKLDIKSKTEPTLSTLTLKPKAKDEISKSETEDH